MLKGLLTLLALFSLGPGTLPAPGPEAEAVPVLASPAPEEAAPEAAPAAPEELRRAVPPRRLSPAEVEALVRQAARRHGVDERLVRAVLWAESGGNPQAISPKGALGLMQLLPETARLLGVRDPFDPRENVEGGTRYLKYCLARFPRDPALALAAYNAGPEAVERHGGVPPYPETEHYVAAVTRAWQGKAWSRTPKAAPAPPPPPPAGLAWRLPAPVWKLPPPQVTVGPPKWKVTGKEGSKGVGIAALAPGSRPDGKPAGRIFY